MTGEDIKNRRLTHEEKQIIKRIARKQAADDDSGIDYSDIPPLTEEQYESLFRFRDRRKVPVHVRLDRDVLNWLKSKGKGHLTRINDILANLMEFEKAHPVRHQHK